MDTQEGVTQRVGRRLAPTTATRAGQRVWSDDAGASRQKQLKYLELVAVCGQHHRRNVRRVVARLVVVTVRRRVGGQGGGGRLHRPAVGGPFDAEHLAVDRRMIDKHLDDPIDAFSDGVEQRVADQDSVLLQQQFDDLDVLIVDGNLCVNIYIYIYIYIFSYRK